MCSQIIVCSRSNKRQSSGLALAGSPFTRLHEQRDDDLVPALFLVQEEVLDRKHPDECVLGVGVGGQIECRRAQRVGVAGEHDLRCSPVGVARRVEVIGRLFALRLERNHRVLVTPFPSRTLCTTGSAAEESPSPCQASRASRNQALLAVR